MTWDGAAYMAARRVERKAEGLCETCGDPWDGDTAKCRECRDAENRRARDNRRYARIGKGVAPALQKAVKYGQCALISPATAKKLLENLDRPRAT